MSVHGIETLTSDISFSIKWSPIRKHIQIHFHEWQVLYFDSHFSEVCLSWSNWQYVSVDSDNGLSPNMRQAIIRINPMLTQFTDAYMRKWVNLQKPQHMWPSLNTYKAFTFIFTSEDQYQHIETETKWLPFSRRYFQLHFLEWKC